MDVKECEDRKNKFERLSIKINDVMMDNLVENKSHIMPHINFTYEDLELITLSLNRSVAIEILNIETLKKKDKDGNNG